MKISCNEFHISRAVRDACGFDERIYASTGNVIIADIKAVRVFTEKLNALFDARGLSEKRVSAGSVNAMGLIDEIFHYVSMLYRRDKVADAMANALGNLDEKFGREKVDLLLRMFCEKFPPVEVYQGKISIDEYLAKVPLDTGTQKIRSNREQTLEEFMLLRLANENPAFKPFGIMFDDTELAAAVGLATGVNGFYDEAWAGLQQFFNTLPGFGPYNNTLVALLREPVAFSPNSLRGQLDYIRTYWKDLLGEWLEKRLLGALDTISEEEKAAWHPTNGGSPDMQPYSFENLMKEYERFSDDSGWMPNVVLLAKTVLVWLDQLTKKYGRPITRLDQIPDEELDTIAAEGFTGLWLIGLWERSNASKRIKQICGNPEAAASAYSLMDYEIASNIGGWDALANLRNRLWQRGVRLASDMVPNHTGMDSSWVIEKPDVFVQRRDCPYPQYTFNGENLSHDGRVGIYLEDHYYDKTDCAVLFKRVDNQTGDVRYIYHGNDGTGMPWNDTAQIDFLNPAAREAVMQEIIHVAQNFPIIRFDAAMVLAKKSIRRLWYPEPGHGGDIATRSESAISLDDFEKAIPNEFWREVVDRIATEVPDTLLLAEAFWMMEGYFVRTLGMHRVYNSAFMNMLKKEENQKYRDTVKNTINFDPQILKRYVNFMNNPDEETAVAQFGRGDKYFGVCTLMITMPGLPMFGHGQIEGFEEKYGMEYTKAYRDEKPDEGLVARHWHDIFPLMKKRYLFSEMEHFLFYDLRNENGVNENVFAYSNGSGAERTLVFYNNKYERATGWIKDSVPYAVKTGSGENDKTLITRSISEGLGLTAEDDKYCIFQEHHSGLWYVRKSRDICEQGMFVMLNGFEAQVLMDIHQVADMPDGRYRILCETLAGRGCTDLNDMWDEIRYKDLYAAFAKYVDESLVTLKPIVMGEEDASASVNENASASDDASAGATSGKTAKKSASAKSTSAKDSTGAAKKIDAMLKAVKKYALVFYEEANKIVERENAALGVKTKKLPTATAQFTQSSKAVKKFVTQFEKAETSASAKSAQSAASEVAFDLYATLGKEKKGDTFIETMLAHNKTFALQYLCYALVSPLADGGKAKAWGLARKFTEHLRKMKMAHYDIRHPLEQVFAVGKTAVVDASKKEAAYDVAKLLVASEFSQQLCGTNMYAGTAWFNKEMSDASLAMTFALMMAHDKADDKASLKLYATLATAKDKAEYKCTEFIAPFMPKKKATATKKKVSATAKKATVGKETATEKKATAGKVTATTKKTTASEKKPATTKKSTASKVTEKTESGKAKTEKSVTTSSKTKTSSAKKASTAAKETAVAKKTTTTKKTLSSEKKPTAAKKATAAKETKTVSKKSSSTKAAATKETKAAAKKSATSKATVTAKKSTTSKTTATTKKTSTSEKKATTVKKTSTAKKAATEKKTTASEKKPAVAKKTATAKKATASKVPASKSTSTKEAKSTTKKTSASKEKKQQPAKSTTTKKTKTKK